MHVSHELRTPLTAIRGHSAADGTVEGLEEQAAAFDVTPPRQWLERLIETCPTL
jgi:signal transduction histidine kinase